MFVLVAPDSGGPRPRFMDMQNLNQLHVEFRGVEDGHVWPHIAVLRSAGDGGTGWNDRFDAMLRYAQRNGWIDAAGSRVRAHIVWS